MRRLITPWAILLFAVMIMPPCMATEVSYGSSTIDQITYTISESGYYNERYAINRVTIYSVGDIHAPFTLVQTRPIVTGSLPPVDSFTSNISLKDIATSKILATGTYGFNKKYNSEGSIIGSVVWIDLDTWDSQGLTGNRQLTIEGATYLPYANDYGYGGSSSSNPIVFSLDKGTSLRADQGDYILNTKVEWFNTLTVEETGSIYIGKTGSFLLERNLNGTSYPSKIKIWTDDGLSYYFNESISDVSYLSTSSPVHCSIYSGLLDTWYNSTWFAAVPTPTPTPEPSSDYFVLSLSPDTAAVGNPITATLTPAADAPAYSYLSWLIDGSLYSTYHLNGTTWYEYDTFTGTYSHATAESAAKTQTLTFATEGSHTVTCRVYDSTLAELASPSATATITGQYSTVTNVTATGFVYDVTTGTTIPGATVSAAQPAAGFSDSDTADASGYFSIAGLKPDFPVSFTTAATNYTSQTVQYTGVPQATTWPITLYLYPDTAPAGASLYGQVYASGTSQGIAGATVGITNGSYSDSTTTSSAGFYEFADLSEGTYTLTATATGHDAVSESVSVGATATQHNVAMTGHYTLTVTAKDATTSAIIANTTVTFSLTDGQETTSATGAATFTVTAGSYTATAAAAGYYPSTAYAYVDRDTTATIFLTAIPEPTEAPDYPNFPPHNVKIIARTIWGSPIAGATITAQGVEQTASSDWFESLLGINTENVPINDELMTGTTDSNGEIAFMMIESVKYSITAYKDGEIDESMYIYPKDDEYTIVASGNAWFSSGNSSLSSISVDVTTSKTDDTGHITVHYNDTTAKTTLLSIQVTQQNATNITAPEDVIDFYNVASDSDVSHTFDVADAGGQSYFVRVEATHSDFGTVKRDYGVTFQGVRVPLGNIPDGLYIYIAGGALLLLGCFFGATSATFGTILICFAGWIFWSFGWLDDIGLTGPIALSFATLISIVMIITRRYREEGYT